MFYVLNIKLLYFISLYISETKVNLMEHLWKNALLKNLLNVTCKVK